MIVSHFSIQTERALYSQVKVKTKVNGDEKIFYILYNFPFFVFVKYIGVILCCVHDKYCFDNKEMQT